MDIVYGVFTFLLIFLGIFSAALFIIVIRNILGKGFQPIQGVIPIFVIMALFLGVFFPAILSLSSLKDAINSKVETSDGGIRLKSSSSSSTATVTPTSKPRNVDSLYGN
jgi:hypothetical protein